ncbi:MAG: carboxypeptidase regulatory-like domain-containing protein [Acidobacteriota bacterium]
MKRCWVVVVALCLLVSALCAAPLQVQLLCPPAAPIPAPKAVRLQIVRVGDGMSTPVATLAAACTAASSAVVDVDAGAVYEVRAAVAGWWSQPSAVFVTNAGAHVVARLWPAGTVKGTLSTDRDLAPQGVTLAFQPVEGPEKSEQQPSWAAPCAVQGQEFTCELPAGRHHLALRSQGFLPHYRWDVKVTPGETLELGRLALRPGSAVTGRITASAAQFDPSQAQVTLEPVAGDRLTASGSGGGELAIRRTRPNTWGHFCFEGLPPGAYGITVAHPEFAPASLSPITVEASGETTLAQPIELRPLATLVLKVLPPHDPYSERWRIDLLHRHPIRGAWDTVVRDVVLGDDGSLVRSGLAEGSYQVLVGDSRGNRSANTRFELTTNSPPLEIELEAVAVEGEVRLGEKEPLSAELFFGGRRGRERIAAHSGIDGWFATVLPRAGKWIIDVESVDPPVTARLRDVVVERPPAGESSRVRLVVPDTRLEGKVVNERHQPVAGATVTALARASQSVEQLLSGPDGRFAFRGLSLGPVDVEASAETEEGELGSEPLRVALDPSRTTPPVTLVLRRSQRVHGRVLGPSGEGVAYASVLALPDWTQGYMPLALPDAVTELDGRFTLATGRDAPVHLLLVQPPGFVAKVVRVARGPRNQLEPIHVSELGGTLTVEAQESFEEGAAASTVLFLWWDGNPIDRLDILAPWAKAHGGWAVAEKRLTIPRMAPGIVRVCQLSAAEVSAAFGGAPPPPTAPCAQGTLQPYAELVLSLPHRRGRS